MEKLYKYEHYKTTKSYLLTVVAATLGIISCVRTTKTFFFQQKKFVKIKCNSFESQLSHKRNEKSQD